MPHFPGANYRVIRDKIRLGTNRWKLSLDIHSIETNIFQSLTHGKIRTASSTLNIINIQSKCTDQLQILYGAARRFHFQSVHSTSLAETEQVDRTIEEKGDASGSHPKEPFLATREA